MQDLPDQLSAAVQHQSAGKLIQAETSCRKILAVDPDNFNALQLLSVIATQSGQFGIAIECLSRAIQINGNDAELHDSLGIVFLRHGDLDQAINCHRRAVEIRPDFESAHQNLANALRIRGDLREAIVSYRTAISLQPDSSQYYCGLAAALVDNAQLDDAIACCHRALQLMPDNSEALNIIANALILQGNVDASIEYFQRAIELKPDFAEAYSGLGDALRMQWRLPIAEEYCRRAVELNPHLAESHNNLGNVLQELGSLEEAAVHYRQALNLKPRLSEPHYNLGLILREQGKLNEAIESYRKAIERAPNHAEAYNGLGNAFNLLGKRREAAAHYDRALELGPELPHVHVNRAGLALLEGDFRRGWLEYEWRWKTAQSQTRHFEQRQWDGRPLNGRTILLHTEQGHGDTIQFIRYAPLVKTLGAEVIVECPKSLSVLLSSCPGIDRLVPKGEKVPPFDVHAPLLSLPTVFNTALHTIPAQVPYLYADPSLVVAWRTRLADISKFRVGINWHGRSGKGTFRERDIPLGHFLRLAQLPSVSLISLQKECLPDSPGITVSGQQLQRVDPDIGQASDAPLFSDPPIIHQLGHDFDVSLGAFMDTAAVMMSLDLVITSDTSIAHLAGALGVPVWVGLPFVPDWRWLLDRSDSPWYPTMRLFRQERAGDWNEVFARIRVVLLERIAA